MSCNSVSGSLDGSARAHITAHWSTALLVLGLGLGTGLLWGQPAMQDQRALAPTPKRGLQVYTVSAYAVYYSTGLPEGIGFRPGLANLASDVGGGGSTRIGWMKSGERSDFSFMYAPSYTGRVRYAAWNALNHSLSLNARQKLTPKWSLGFSVAGDLSNLAELLFSPTVFSNVASTSANFDDLAAAMLAGKFTNAQLASILTGAPLVESPARNLFYGDRMFMSALRASLSYSPSPRLSISLGAGGGRSQYVSDSQNIGAPGYRYLVPSTTSGSANLTVSYSRSPRTQIGATVASSRILSSLQDTYVTTSTASLGRTMGRRWFLQIQGGVGVMNPVRQTFILPRGPQPIGGGSLGFRTFSHTFLGSYDRTVSDSYGYGAGSTSSVSAAWRWSRPGRGWSLEGSLSRQELQGSGFENLKSWRATAGLGRALAAQLALLTQYVYLGYSGRLENTPYSFSQSALRVSLVWFSQPNAPR